MVTGGVEFSFDDVMYRQVDGVAMGSPLGPLLANVFVGYCESLIPIVEYPQFYRRFLLMIACHISKIVRLHFCSRTALISYILRYVLLVSLSLITKFRFLMF